MVQITSKEIKMPIMEISVVPLGTKTPSVSRYVADALKVLEREKNIKYQLTSMGTIIEADSLDELLDVAKKMHETTFAGGAQRVVTTIKIDERRDKKLSIEGKIKSVKGKISGI